MKLHTSLGIGVNWFWYVSQRLQQGLTARAEGVKTERACGGLTEARIVGHGFKLSLSCRTHSVLSPARSTSSLDFLV